jgi:hypothetical protein
VRSGLLLLEAVVEQLLILSEPYTRLFPIDLLLYPRSDHGEDNVIPNPNMDAEKGFAWSEIFSLVWRESLTKSKSRPELKFCRLRFLFHELLVLRR